MHFSTYPTASNHSNHNIPKPSKSQTAPSPPPLKIKTSHGNSSQNLSLKPMSPNKESSKAALKHPKTKAMGPNKQTTQNQNNQWTNQPTNQTNKKKTLSTPKQTLPHNENQTDHRNETNGFSLRKSSLPPRPVACSRLASCSRFSLLSFFSWPICSVASEELRWERLLLLWYKLGGRVCLLVCFEGVFSYCSWASAYIFYVYDDYRMHFYLQKTIDLCTCFSLDV